MCSNVPLHSSSKVDSTRYNANGSKTSGIMKNVSKLTPNNHGGQSSRTCHFPSCFKCKQVGYYINECPNRQDDAQGNFAEEEDANEQLEDIEELRYNKYVEEASKEIAPKLDECLVIHRALATPRDDSNEE